MIKINSNGLVADILESYTHWSNSRKILDIHQTDKSFHNNDGVDCFHYTDLTKINQYNNKTIVIDCLTESLHSDTFFKKYDKSNFYVIFSGGNWDQHKYDFGNLNYRLIYFPYFLWCYKQFYTSTNYLQSYLENNYLFRYPKIHEFVSTTGAKRPARSKFLEILLTYIEYNNYVFKYAGDDIGVDSSIYDFSIVDFKKTGAYTSIDSYEQYYLNLSATLPINLYNTSYYNLVLETDIDYQDCFFITEKTIKSFISGMPFVIVSTPYFLKNLKDMGFMTYDSMWDESYDEEIDFEKRCNKIAKLCRSLKDFDWVKNKHNLEYIGLRNQQVFYTQNKIMDQYFVNLEKTLLSLSNNT